MKHTKRILSVLLAAMMLLVCLVPAFAEDGAACNHTWIWTIDTEPTCGEAGVQHQYCPACGSTQNEGTEIPATNEHTWEWSVDAAATCGREGRQHETCTVCGKTRSQGTKIAATGEHSWNGGEVSRQPTCAQVGIMVYTCAVCGNQEARDIDKVAHADNDGNGQCDSCGISMATGNTGVSLKSIFDRVGNFFWQIWLRIQKLFTGEYFK